jgi:hypothetical protein
MVVVAIAAEIINAEMIWRNLFAFIQLFKPSARWKVAECEAVRVNGNRTAQNLSYLQPCVL